MVGESIKDMFISLDIGMRFIHNASLIPNDEIEISFQLPLINANSLNTSIALVRSALQQRNYS